MTSTAATRKPVAALDPEDLATFPTWEFAIDEEGREDQDETFVRPVPGATTPRRNFVLGLRATFVTPGGLGLDGVIWGTTAAGLEVEDAALFVGSRYTFLAARGAPFCKESRQAAAAALGIAEASLFPLRFQLHLAIDGERSPRDGVFA